MSNSAVLESDRPKTSVRYRSRDQAQRRPSQSGRRSFDLKVEFPPYWDKEKVDQGIAQGQVAVGTFHLLPNKQDVAFVRIPDAPGSDIYVEGVLSRNRAMQGDSVAVEITGFAKHDNRKRTQAKDVAMELTHVEADYENEAKEPLWFPTESIQPTEAKAKDVPQPEQRMRIGKVVSILASNTANPANAQRESVAQHVGKLQPQNTRLASKGHPLPSADTFAYFVPKDTRIPRLQIPRGDLPFEFVSNPLVHGDKFLYRARLTYWDPNQRYPFGKLDGRVGEANQIVPETDAILISNDLNHGEFSSEVLECLSAFRPGPNNEPWTVPESEVKQRRDLRNELVFTVDPLTAKDLDDALHCKYLGNDQYEVGVHIADVSYFIEEGSALDLEAHRRSTTVYLVQKAIPMLPPLLSEDLCSLNPKVDRLAYSCIWRMNSKGELIAKDQPWFGRTIIRSACKLDYGLAQRIVDEGPDLEDWNTSGRLPETERWSKSEVHQSLCNLVRIGMNRRALRFDPKRGGALELASLKMSFRLDAETGNPVGVRNYQIHDTNRTIEEFMLMANFLVAQELIRTDRANAFLRHHPPPDAKGVALVVDLLRRVTGSNFLSDGIISPGAINELMKRLQNQHADAKDPELSRKLALVSSHLMRMPMKNALYFVGSQQDQREWRHWALNIQ